jgi:hypothetical protein
MPTAAAVAAAAATAKIQALDAVASNLGLVSDGQPALPDNKSFGNITDFRMVRCFKTVLL